MHFHKPVGICFVVFAGQKRQRHRCSLVGHQRCSETWDHLNFSVQEACILRQEKGNPSLSLLVKCFGNRIARRCQLSVTDFLRLHTSSLSISYCFHQGFRSNVFPLRSQACFDREQVELWDFQLACCSTLWCASGVELMAFRQSGQLPCCSGQCSLPRIAQLFGRDSWARHHRAESFEWWKWLQFGRALFLVP